MPLVDRDRYALKITMRFKFFCSYLFSQEHYVSYFVDNFTFCTHIAGRDIAYRDLHHMTVVLLSLHQYTGLPC
jgi:hypothetical protein